MLQCFERLFNVDRNRRAELLSFKGGLSAINGRSLLRRTFFLKDFIRYWEEANRTEKPENFQDVGK